MKTFVSAAALFCAAALLTGCTAGQQLAVACGIQKGLANSVNDYAWRRGNYSSAIDGMIDADVEEDQCIEKAVALDMPPPEPVLPWPVCNKEARTMKPVSEICVLLAFLLAALLVGQLVQH